MHIDWGTPWNAPWRAPGERVAARVAGGLALHDALDAEGGAGVPRFVAQSALPAGAAYEQFIFETNRCPTREGLHDFFHGLCWLRFPRAKRQLNRLQAGEIARLGTAGRRGPVRDAITVFDENGALLDAPPALWEALLARQWQRLFVDLRPLWAQARLLVFGHALLEKLVTPRKDLTAHVWAEPCRLADLAEADEWLAGRATAERLAAKPFTPLPVLGVPGWWPGNENFSFYDDSLVFRPRKAPPTTTTALQPGPGRTGVP
jgi:hypothetical protein